MHKRHWAVVGAAVSALSLAATPALGVGSNGTPGGQESIQQLHQEALHNTLSKTHGSFNYCAAHGLACNLWVLSTGHGSHTVLTTQAPSGIGATDLEQAYNLKKAKSQDGTIVIIDAAAYPPADLENSLNTYRSAYGLPDCTLKSGCLSVYNRFGGKPFHPPVNPRQQQEAEEIGVETSLDVEMASAACPGCKIVELQVPAKDGFFGSSKHIHRATHQFGRATQTANKMGAAAVSISYGFPADSVTDSAPISSLMDQKGMAIAVSSGDSGYVGRSGTWPQNLRTVMSVGGTTLTAAPGNPRGFTESAWFDGGSSCSPDLGPAIGQPKTIAKNCNNMRADTDISSDAAVQIAFYDGYAPYSHNPYGWSIVGGTSAAAPFVGAVAARSPRIANIEGPNVLYSDPSKAFYDVTTGTNGSSCVSDGFSAKVCAAGKGWDGPTGLGTPDGLAPFTS
jgi:subtilase family serine protease